MLHLAILFLFLFFSPFIQALEPYYFQADLSHTEGSGIGYKRGFTTLEGFFIMEDCSETLYPFLDIRGHGFDNRKLAANIGGGIRYINKNNWIFGANIYYDLRQGDHRGFDRVGHCFHQMGIGLEALSEVIDFRLNFYQPVGKKQWRFTQIHFNDNAGITPVYSFKRQTTFTSLNAEFGGFIDCGNFCHCINWRTYLAIGPYMIKENHKNQKWGIALRLNADLTPFFTLEIRTGYDQKYLGYGQIKAWLHVPLFPFSSVLHAACSICSDFKESITEAVYRMDIIPLSTSRF